MKNFREFFRRLTRKKITVICLVILTLIVFAVIFSLFVAPYGYDDQNYRERMLAPSLAHLCGTDNYGRDIFSRLLYGGRISLLIGISVSLITTVIGGLIGCAAAYFGGRTDNLIMRFFDIMGAIPPMLLSMVVAATLGTGIFNTILALVISGIPGKARTARGPVLALRSQEYIEAATALNTPTFKIILRHIFPNIMAPMIVQTTLSISRNIVQVSSLSFLGLGVQPPTPEWGQMLSAGRSFLRDCPWMVLAPGLIMMLTLFSLNIVGDAVRDALDPKLKD